MRKIAQLLCAISLLAQIRLFFGDEPSSILRDEVVEVIFFLAPLTALIALWSGKAVKKSNVGEPDSARVPSGTH